MTERERNLMADLAAASLILRPRDPSLHYRNAEDFVVREGRAYTPGLAPRRMGRGAPQKCFGNAVHAATLYGLVYVEGFASNPRAVGPVHHAWNVDPATGLVIDLTWGIWKGQAQLDPYGDAYIGVEFSVERADDATWHGDATVLDDHNRGWPLLREPWQGEPSGLVWPRSPRIEAARAARDGDFARARALYAEVIDDLERSTA